MTEIKRRTRRLFAALLGLLMALSLLSTTAFANDGEATIVVTLPTGEAMKDVDLSGITVTPYLVLDQVNDEETDVSKKQYEVTEGFKTFFDHQDNVAPDEGFTSGLAAFFDGTGTVYLTYNETDKKLMASKTKPEDDTKYIALTNAKALDQTYPEAELLSRITAADDLTTLYSWIEKYIKAKVEEGTLSPAKSESGVDGSGTTMTINGLNEGYYALLFANTPSAVSVTQGIMVATTGTTPVEIELKSETVPLVKQVKNPDHTGEDFNDTVPLQETTADVGDTLTYHITTKVPTLANTENLTIFKMEDTMQNQQLTGSMTLTLTKDGGNTVSYIATVPAIAQGETSATAFFTGNSKTIATLTVNAYGQNSTTGVNEQTFTVDFMAQGLTDAITKYQGYTVTLTYNAMVTADAVQVNENDVKLYVNNNDKPLEDKTKVYTYGIEVQKTFSDGSIDKFGNVKFSLYTDKEYQEGNTKTALTLYGTDGVYKTAGTSGGTSTLALAADGKLTITGLDVGTYWLVENETADGYTKSEDIKIVLVAGTEDKSVLVKDDDAPANGTYAQFGDNGSYLSTTIGSQDTTQISLAKFDVLNQKGFELPETGGAGTWMFTIGGILLVAAAGVLFVLSRKKDGSK